MRAGLTGLGLVFLATLAASVVFAPEPTPATKEPTEPLAQLGVAPGPEKNGANGRIAPEALPEPGSPASPQTVPAPAAPPESGPGPLVPDAATLPAVPHDSRQVTI